LILSFVPSRHPPFPPDPPDWHVQGVSQVFDPAFGADDGDEGVDVSGVNPLGNKIDTILSLF
jgi:hypothetical protein